MMVAIPAAIKVDWIKFAECSEFKPINNAIKMVRHKYPLPLHAVNQVKLIALMR